jgi:hypothetical protein
MPSHPPFKAGDPKTREYASRGGRVAKEQRRLRAAATPLTKGLLGHLLTYTTSDWMDRLGLVGDSWNGWRIIGKVLDGLPLTAEQMTTYTQVTGRTTVPTDLRELWALAGRGSGKTSFMALCAVKAACRGYAGVRGLPRVLLLAFVKEQAGVAFEYVSEFFDQDRELRALATSRTRDSITLAHGVRLQTLTSSWRSVRGYSVACALCDEAAMWWLDEADANPALEIIRALRPGLGKVPGSRLLVATTPWTEEGVVYDTHQKHYGNEESQHVLVLRAPTRVLNPSFDAATIAIAEAEDAESAASEYGVAWRTAGGTLVHPAAYDACVDHGVTEREPEPPLGADYYRAAVDLSGGTGQDSAALSIQHVEQDADAGVERCVQDLLTEWAPPFDPGVMCGEIAAACRRFGIVEVTGDQFSEGFAASEFRRHGIAYAVSERKTAECVLDSLAVLNTHRVRLLDVPKMRRQWLNLRRDYASGGRPTILETKRHDDLAVVTARGIVAALGLGVEPEARWQVQFR